MQSGSLHPISMTKMLFRLIYRPVELKNKSEAKLLMISEDKNSSMGEVAMVNPASKLGKPLRLPLELSCLGIVLVPVSFRVRIK